MRERLPTVAVAVGAIGDPLCDYERKDYTTTTPSAQPPAEFIGAAALQQALSQHALAEGCRAGYVIVPGVHTSPRSPRGGSLAFQDALYYTDHSLPRRATQAVREHGVVWVSPDYRSSKVRR